MAKNTKHDLADDENYVSKSQIKRELEALQKLGKELIALTPQQLTKIKLDPDLLDAIQFAHRISNKREALRRHIQYIGKIMRHVDSEAIEEQLAILRNESIYAKTQLHQLEKLREELIEQGDERLSQLLNEHPELDRQNLRQWIRQAQKEKQSNKTPKASRALFKYLREQLLSI